MGINYAHYCSSPSHLHLLHVNEAPGSRDFHPEMSTKTLLKFQYTTIALQRGPERILFSSEILEDIT